MVWHSGLTAKNRKDLERVQKAAVRVILKTKHVTYKEGLKQLKIETLEKRREILCLRFANNCLTNSKVINFFPKKEKVHKMRKRKELKFVVNKTNTLLAKSIEYRKCQDKCSVERIQLITLS